MLSIIDQNNSDIDNIVDVLLNQIAEKTIRTIADIGMAGRNVSHILESVVVCCSDS